MTRCLICHGIGWISVSQGLYDTSKRCVCNPRKEPTRPKQKAAKPAKTARELEREKIATENLM